jgi:hypothetical protein
MQNNIKKSIIHSLDPVRYSSEVLGFKPDTWQAEVLRYEGNRLMMLCSRQSGKSSVAAVKALYTALFYPNSLTLIVSPSQRQSSEMFRLITKQMELLNDPPIKTEDNKLSLTLASGSRIVSLPSQADTVRGYAAPKLVIVDEAARCTNSLYLAIRPFFATGNGQLILLSTPNGRQGFFFDAWQSNAEDWKKVLITAEDCPRISKEFLQAELETLGSYFYNQEYGCQFVEGENAVFRYSDILSCFKQEIEAINLWEDE